MVVWDIFPSKERNKSKMGCGDRGERERVGEENLRDFTELSGNKWKNKNLTRFPVPGNNTVNILYSPYHDPLHMQASTMTDQLPHFSNH